MKDPHLWETPERESALQFLYGRIDYERTPTIPYQERSLKLVRMEQLLVRLGSPHDGLRIVHVAGSKGKGSTAAMIASILSASGYRTGLYTSPHLERLEERISINGASCSGGELVELVQRVRPEVEAMDRQTNDDRLLESGPTYFDITTALALLHFAWKEVDIAVMEVGLGGRLDSTNVCQPIVSVITSISFDHTKQLGHTLAKIAGEKAGIIKRGVPVVSGVRHGAARRVIEETARGKSSPWVTLGVDFEIDYHPTDYASSGGIASALLRGRCDYRPLRLPGAVPLKQLDVGMLGRHQAANAAVALAVVDQLRQQSWDISESSVRQGLANVFCAARIEIVSRQPLVIVDVAHNVASVQALLETIDEVFPRGGHRTLIFATTRGKDVPGMLQEFLPRFDHIIFTRYQMNPRAFDPQRLFQLAGQIAQRRSPPVRPCRVEVEFEPLEAWSAARDGAGERDLVCVTGSFFIAAELKPVIVEQLSRSRHVPLLAK